VSIRQRTLDLLLSGFWKFVITIHEIHIALTGLVPFVDYDRGDTAPDGNARQCRAERELQWRKHTSDATS
jgi:hypothetical protein